MEVYFLNQQHFHVKRKAVAFPYLQFMIESSSRLMQHVYIIDLDVVFLYKECDSVKM